MMCWSNPVRAASAQNWLGVAPAEVKRCRVFVPALTALLPIS